MTYNVFGGTLNIAQLNSVCVYLLCRVLYGNQISELPPGVFVGLHMLQLL